MLSSLSRGYGTWCGLLGDQLPETEESLPTLDTPLCSHRHGITVTPRARTAPNPIPVTDDGQLHIPKTYTTRKGALVLFSGSEYVPEEPKKSVRTPRKKRHKDLIDLSLKLKTLERLSMSVLQFGDKEYNKESVSISDKDNSLSFNFLHELTPEHESDMGAQPGSDLKVYLRDLKRRASRRGFGDGDAPPYRARSAELQEILDQLESVWPKYTQSYTGDSGFQSDRWGGGGYMDSPTPSTGSLTRNKILSAKKLTASLKSLDVGRSISAEPDRFADNMSVMSESARSLPEVSFGRTRSARVWNSNASVAHREQIRPKTSHYGGRQQLVRSQERHLPSPVPDSATASAQPMWVETCSYASEDGQSMTSGLDSDFRLRAMTPSSQRSRTPVRAGDRDVMLAEAASVLSSLVEEENMDHLLDNLSDEEQDTVDVSWPGGDQLVTGRATPALSSRSKMPLPRVDETMQTEDMEDTMTQPLQPPYEGVMRREETPTADRQDEELLARLTGQDLRPESRAGVLQGAAREPTPVGQMVDQTSRAASRLGSASADRPAPDPDTLVSLHREDNASAYTSAQPSRSGSAVGRVATPSVADRTQVDSPLAKDGERDVLSPALSDRKQSASTVEVAPEEEVEVINSDDEEDETGLSRRVRRELEEKEKRIAERKAQREKEERERMEEEERLKWDAEEKRLQAEERLRNRAEDLAKLKEQQLLQVTTPEPPKSAKGKKGRKDSGKKTSDALDKLKEANKPPPFEKDTTRQYLAVTPPPKVEAPPEEKDMPDHLKEMLVERKTDDQAQQELDDEIGRMQHMMDEALSGTVLQPDSIDEDTEGLSAEDFEAAQLALMEKIKKAEEKIDEVATPSDKKKPPVTPRAKAGPKSPATRKKNKEDEQKKKKEREDKEALKEQQRMEKIKRLEEVRDLQTKIKGKEDARKKKEAEAKIKAEDLAERMDDIRMEESQLQQAEEDARQQLAAVRKTQREEREARRKADLEKKKQEAIDRREKEKIMIEEARLKEQEMLDKIADNEMKRRLKEEEDAKREEEEMQAQERYEAELKAAELAAEEEEEKLRELERLAEEEAFQRLLDEKDAAEIKRRELEVEAQRMKEEEAKIAFEMAEEQKKIEAERRKLEEEEEARRELERGRLRELQRLEEAARDKMRAELEKRRAWAMKRREHNLDQRANLDAMRQSQGVTDPWTFSYFVKWPKESYMRSANQEAETNQNK